MADQQTTSTVFPGWEDTVPRDSVMVPRAMAMHWAWRLESAKCSDFCGGPGKCQELGMKRCALGLHRDTLRIVLEG